MENLERNCSYKTLSRSGGPHVWSFALKSCPWGRDFDKKIMNGGGGGGDCNWSNRYLCKSFRGTD